MTLQTLNSVRIPVLTLLICVLTGCGGTDKSLPELGQVTGVVTFKSQPLADANIVFEPASGTSSVGKTDSAGKYVLAFSQDAEGATIGEHTVRITKFGEPGSPNDTENQLPEKYGAQSILNAEVVPGENTFDFPLE